jgi:hypothetical protein
MRNMSFMLTTEQIRNRTKTVTRRRWPSWGRLKPGDLIQACERCQGLGAGGKVKRICVLRIVKNAPESLTPISQDEVNLEGFPNMDPDRFVEMFCKHMKCVPTTVVNRIEFEYVD